MDLKIPPVSSTVAASSTPHQITPTSSFIVSQLKEFFYFLMHRVEIFGLRIVILMYIISSKSKGIKN